jgi:drug/metabolite transporter (DMT)-like permease
VGATSLTGLPLVALAAALWGTDALFRRGLALELPATTVVFYEHLILATLTLPVLRRIPWDRLTSRDRWCLLLIGGGASALATVMFTAAFRFGDPNTPLLLQKLQPLVAIVGARVLLGEVLRPRFAWYVGAGVAGGWLITFPDPLSVQAEHLAAGALAAGAAALWAMGTVLGRRMTTRLSPHELTAARFGIGLPVALVLLVAIDGPAQLTAVRVSDLPPLVLLALIPGLLALRLYYRGLRDTPASAATLAELTFPAAALAVNYVAFGATITLSQTVGVLVLSGTLVTMSWAGRRQADVVGIRTPVATRHG